MTEQEEIYVKHRLWDAGFSGPQSAERGPVMLEVFALINEVGKTAKEQAMLFGFCTFSIGFILGMIVFTAAKQFIGGGT